MKRSLYITKEGVIYRKGSTIYFQNIEMKKVIPINAISDIFCYGSVTVRAGASHLLMRLNIPVHFFSKYGVYLGSLVPKENFISGKIIVEQVKHYIDNDKRLEIAKEIVSGIKHNILKTLEYYQRRGKQVNIENIDNIEINIAKNIPQLMSIEGKIWENYYKEFNNILVRYRFEKRVRRPPGDEINSLISFGNSMLYCVCISELFNTYLNPSISFLHEPRERRYSLALDISELFKPLFVSRVIFTLVNKRILTHSCFDTIQYYTFLNDKGKKIFIKYFNEKLDTTIFYPELRRKVSYRKLIRLECYKLIKHILGDKKYRSFRMWW